MLKALTLAALTALATGPALAAGSHSGGHAADDAHMDGHHHDGRHADGMMAVGRPGDAADAGRTIQVLMLENEDGTMVFLPSAIEAQRGETVRLYFENRGELAHEFVMDQHQAIMEHKELMERFPEMEHDDPNAIRLEPGESGEIVWTFSNPGQFEFACLIPGHHDLGMKGKLAVAN